MPVVDRPVAPSPRPERRRAASSAAAGLALLVAATACSVADGAEDDRLVLEVGDMPATTRTVEREVWERRVAQFEEQHPDIRVEGSETSYDPEGFGTLLAGGTLPDVLLVPLTEPKALLRGGEIADLGEALADTGVGESLNPTLLAAVTGDDGGVYGVPVSGYSMGLVYNRDVFLQAGLDPDAPPRTWDEVREAASTIAEGTDAVGFGHAAAENGGGFVLTAETYSFGGRVQEDGGELLLTEGPVAEALEVLRAMRWEDGSAGVATTTTADDLVRELAAGRLGMYVAAPDQYGAAVGRYEMPPEDFGVGALPRGTDGEGYASLAGGTVAVVAPDTDEATRRAAVEWVDFYSLARYTDREAAEAEVEALRDQQGVFIGVPGLSPVDDASYRKWQQWVEEDITVPLEQFAGYTEALRTEDVEPEPPVEAQKVYAALDEVVQAVLVDEEVDLDELLARTQERLTAELERG